MIVINKSKIKRKRNKTNTYLATLGELARNKTKRGGDEGQDRRWTVEIRARRTPLRKRQRPPA